MGEGAFKLDPNSGLPLVCSLRAAATRKHGARGRCSTLTGEEGGAGCEPSHRTRPRSRCTRAIRSSLCFRRTATPRTFHPRSGYFVQDWVDYGLSPLLEDMRTA